MSSNATSTHIWKTRQQWNNDVKNTSTMELSWRKLHTCSAVVSCQVVQRMWEKDFMYLLARLSITNLRKDKANSHSVIRSHLQLPAIYVHPKSPNGEEWRYRNPPRSGLYQMEPVLRHNGLAAVPIIDTSFTRLNLSGFKELTFC